MSGRLEGKVAIVTGGGSGIGRAAVELFCREGAKVIVADITGTQNDVAEATGATAMQTDVSKDADVAALIAAAIDAHGRLDVLFNNAGIDGELGPTEASTEDNFDHTIAVNLKGVFLGLKHALPVMREAGSGSIINTASVAGIVGMPMLGPYCASKGGVVQLTKAAAAECGPAGVRVNAICPGAIDTPLVAKLAELHPEAVAGADMMTPMGRKGRPEEVAALALFLASDEASFVTGAAIPVDGGYTCM